MAWELIYSSTVLSSAQRHCLYFPYNPYFPHLFLSSFIFNCDSAFLLSPLLPISDSPFHPLNHQLYDPTTLQPYDPNNIPDNSSRNNNNIHTLLKPEFDSGRRR